MTDLFERHPTPWTWEWDKLAGDYAFIYDVNGELVDTLGGLFVPAVVDLVNKIEGNKKSAE